MLGWQEPWARRVFTFSSGNNIFIGNSAVRNNLEWLQKNGIVAILQVRPKVIGFHMPLGEAKIEVKELALMDEFVRLARTW